MKGHHIQFFLFFCISKEKSFPFLVVHTAPPQNYNKQPIVKNILPHSLFIKGHLHSWGNASKAIYASEDIHLDSNSEFTAS